MEALEPFERAIEDVVIRLIKEVCGKGPIYCGARIVADTIYVRTKMERSLFEVELLQFIKENGMQEKFSDYMKPHYMATHNEFLRRIHYDLYITDMEVKKISYSGFAVIFLNQDLEQLIYTGKAKLPK